jgi:hypothetical protein
MMHGAYNVKLIIHVSAKVEHKTIFNIRYVKLRIN